MRWLMYTGAAMCAALCAHKVFADRSPDVPRSTGMVTGLGAPVEISFDALGVPRITGDSFEDVASALGYAHAQDRYFQMDLLRRRASGRLSELVGEYTLAIDIEVRAYGFSGVAKQVVLDLPPRHAAWLEAYSAGVNAGLSELGVPPLEYSLISVQPEPWSPEDSVLVMLMMTMDLSSGESSERVRSALVDSLPIEIADLLTPTTARFDAPFDADERDPTGGYEAVPIPGQEVFSVRGRESSERNAPAGALEEERVALGSNSWAVAGSKTVHGGAILANDMHLTHSLPNIWYRADLEWKQERAGQQQSYRAAGVSLPGLPGIVVGSSGTLAWGFTNFTGDLVDLVRIETDPEDPGRYRVPGGWERFGTRAELIEVRGTQHPVLNVRTTRWGPLVRPAHDGTLLAMRWAGLDAAATNLALLDLPWAQTLEEGVELMRSWMGPPQNALLADDQGDIAWVPSGFIPVRSGLDGRVSVSWADEGIGWKGSLEGDDRPAVIRPESGLLFTANNRVLSIRSGSPRFGDDFASGVRAARIKELLQAGNDWSELGVFRVALDTRVTMMEHYREHLHAAMREHDLDDDELVSRAMDIIDGWDGTANADQPGYRLLREYRARLQRAVLGPLLATATEAYPGFRYTWFNHDEPVLRLLEERPMHLLNPIYSGWDELLATEFEAMVRALGPGENGGIETPWGETNRSAIAHPLSEVLPERFRAILAAEAAPLDGDVWSVRVARPTVGASERMAVSPGREEFGLLHMPGGQSGKPMSPHFKDQHRAWLSGDPLPLLSGRPSRTLILTPMPE